MASNNDEQIRSIVGPLKDISLASTEFLIHLLWLVGKPQKYNTLMSWNTLPHVTEYSTVKLLLCYSQLWQAQSQSSRNPTESPAKKSDFCLKRNIHLTSI